MQITVIGTGFVGVVSAAVYASFGNTVYGIDIDAQKIESLRASTVPFYEPGLQELLLEQQKSGNLSFTTKYEEAVPASEVIIIAVGTPSAADGGADLKFVLSAAQSAAEHLQENAIVVIKSTVPPGTLQIVAAELAKHTQKKFFIASLPEFLREGTAVHDTLHPDRIVIGTDAPEVAEKLSELHKQLAAPIVITKPQSAQMAKYAANAYLALRITFINQIADLCEKNGADVEEVVSAIGYDKRIGSHYWYPGLGYGGSCFPKDVKELAHYSKQVGENDNLFIKVNELNTDRIPRLMDSFGKEVGGWEGKQVAVLGLSFKPNTDDMREAPSLSVVPALLAAGAVVRATDPKAIDVARAQLPPSDRLTFLQTVSEACMGADVILLLIEWPEYVTHEYGKYRSNTTQWFIDTRNQLDPKVVTEWGYTHRGIGRGA